MNPLLTPLWILIAGAIEKQLLPNRRESAIFKEFYTKIGSVIQNQVILLHNEFIFKFDGFLTFDKNSFQIYVYQQNTGQNTHSKICSTQHKDNFIVTVS